VRYHGYCSNAARGKRRKLDQSAEVEGSAADDPTLSEVSGLRRSWDVGCEPIVEVIVP